MSNTTQPLLPPADQPPTSSHTEDRSSTLQSSQHGATVHDNGFRSHDINQLPPIESSFTQKLTPRAYDLHPGQIVEKWRVLYDEKPPGFHLASFPINRDMPYYTGAWIITDMVWKFRNIILENYLVHQSFKHLLNRDFDVWFSASGVMTERCVLLRYYRDLRLFDQNTWELLTSGDMKESPQVDRGQGYEVMGWMPNAHVAMSYSAQIAAGKQVAAEEKEVRRLGRLLFEEVERVPEEDDVAIATP